MTESKPWTLRYRESQVVRQGTILATSEELARMVGQAYCNQEGNRRFIAVENPVLADESILRGNKELSGEWEALTAVERLAQMQHKTVEEVLNDLKTKRKVSPLESQSEPVGASKK